MEHDSYELVTAAELEARGILKRGTAFRMVRNGLLPAYRVGVTGRGLRFSVPEVVSALRRAGKSEDHPS